MGGQETVHQHSETMQVYLAMLFSSMYMASWVSIYLSIYPYFKVLIITKNEKDFEEKQEYLNTGDVNDRKIKCDSKKNL